VSVSLVLDRLARVKQTKPNHWMAACPCCESRRGRPLSVSEAVDGRTLIHAFCGCPTENVLGRIGLELADLFDQPTKPAIKPVHFKLNSTEVLQALSTEATVLAVIASDFLEKREVDWDRLARCAAIITGAATYINERAK
jgi:hypothetical protein